MADEIDFDVLARNADESKHTIEDMDALYVQVFALPNWHFISRGQFPNIHPYIAANAQVASGQDLLRAFTDMERLNRFALENKLMEKDTDGIEQVLILSVPTEKIVDYLEQFIPEGVYGIWFNSDGESYGFFAPLKQLRQLQQHLRDVN